MLMLDRYTIDCIMSDNKIDSQGRPLRRIISMSDGFGRQFEILPELQLCQRITKRHTLLPTRYAVYLKITNVHYEKISPWYERYGNALNKMVEIVKEYQEKYGALSENWIK